MNVIKNVLKNCCFVLRSDCALLLRIRMNAELKTVLNKCKWHHQDQNLEKKAL